MKKSIFTLFISVISIATFAINMVSTETKPFKLSIDHDSVRAYNGPETLTYSPFWSEEEGETAEITQNSETFLSKQTHEGDVVWQTSQDGVHYFEHKIRNASGEIIETETAAFAKNVGTEFYTVRFNANQGIGNMPNQIFAVNEAKALSKNTFTREGYKFVGWEKRSEYLVVDLSGGTSAASYPVTTLSEVPAGGWTDEYKTTKLVLRKITAGKMPRTDVDITLTKDYYIGVFEVTQRQWELVMGSNPSNFDGNTLPVEKVTYEDIRGTNDGSQWPASNAVDATSFMGKLRAKTGIDFDLPTEAQWEYACRAGSSGDWGLLADGTMGTLDAMGWYGGNSSSKTHLVGTKTPNAWGLYDMHGNVWEWCLDWDSSSGYSGSDPVGGTSGDCRVLHSGSWYYNDAYFCESSYRNSNNPDIRLNSYGLRVAAPAGINIAQTYEVTFNANGGEGTMPSQTFTHGVEQALSANAFTREGHTFAGWATSADGAVAYTAGESISVTAPMTLYAVWKANTYEVNFNANGGEGTMSSQTFTHGVAQAIKANAFTREGYTFAGWATSADGTVAYTAGQSISISAPMTLYAVWKANTYEVNFNANGGEGTMSSQTFTHGVAQAIKANAFTREGRTFAGWATSADGTVAYTAGQSISITAPMTLYAVWKANTYAVNFNANGGEGTMSSQTFTHGVAQAIKANAFTREGYTFAGWATSADGTIAYTAGESISITAPMTLYAVWKAKTYTVTFKPNGGEGTMSSQTFTHGVAQTIKANAFTREGRTFAGWATSADGTVAYTAGQSISITAPMTLYAVWKTNTYAVNFNANGGKGTMPAQTFTHGVAQAIKANAFTREGYTFAGWATRADGTVAYTAGQSISISAPMTLYAVWKANTYEVNFNANGGEGTMSFQTFTHGVAQAIKANAFTRDGYTFAGWATSADGTIAYTAGQSISITAPMTLYAVWKAITYEVNFNANGGEGTMPAQTFTHGVEQALSANTFTRKGYTFAGWATSADGTIAYTAGESISISAPQTLYAVWKANTYEVNFNANGGKGTMSSQTFTYGVAQAIKANAFTREGYIFAGWATSADGVVAYTAGESISISAPMTLYAVWDTPCYIVVDLSRAARYSVTTLSDVPVGGWTDEYKTTKLVLRKITAGKMPRTDIDLTLTKDYYVGVFEVTQTQWELVMGSNPSSFYGDTSPVEQVSYNDIRGSSNGSQWPASNAVDATSFMGKLRAKTGIDFDLPTEAQWEYACRAGSTGDWGLLANGTMGTLYAMGWYFDRNSIRRTHTVGAITPNAWGLYDMHGNVYEWCLDWYSSSGYSGTDPVGATSGNRRVKRGGSWKSEDYSCGSSDRSYNYPDLEDNYSGLRIAAPAGL